METSASKTAERLLDALRLDLRRLARLARQQTSRATSTLARRGETLMTACVNSSPTS